MADQLTPTHAVHSTLESSAGPLAALIGSPKEDPRAMILLVPGYTGSKEDFAPIIDPLVDHGFVTIAIDQPGQFESPGPDTETAYTPAALGLVLASVIAGFALDHPVLLLGHSFGGLVSREAVLHGADVGGLVLLCSGPAAFGSGNRFDALTAGAPVLREHGPQVLYDNGQKAAGADPLNPDPLARFLRRRFSRSSRAGLLGMGSALLSEPDHTAALAAALTRRRTPVAVVAGEADDAWPLAAQRGMAATLGTELVLVPGGGHSPAIEAPQALLDVLLPLFLSWTEH